MKILKIHFKNINSLRGEHEVDFSTAPLVNSGLFAITGPTGSGKSTLLDVITLALFNRIPRLGKVSKNFIAQSGALLTRNTTEAFASVDYECAQGRFRSSWEISLNRNGKLREYHMELSHLGKAERFDLKKAQVSIKNEELIGLNYEQFVKSIMLAQGEFAEFLRVSKSERGELLEKITGTGIYRELGKKAFEKKREFAAELEKLRERKEVLSESLLDEDSLKQHLENSKKLAQEQSRLKAEISTLETQQVLRQEIAQGREQLHKLQLQLREHREIRQKFKVQYGEKLQRHEDTADFASEMEDWKMLSQKHKEQLEMLQKLQEEQQSQDKRRQSLLKEINTFLSTPAEPGEVSTALENFRQEVEKIDQRLLEFRSAYKSQLQQLKDLGASWEYQPQFQLPEAEIEKLKNWQSANHEHLSRLEDQLNIKPDQDIESLEKKFNQQLIAAERGKTWQENIAKLELRLEKLSAELRRLRKLEQELPARIEKIGLEGKLVQAKVKNLKLAIANQQLRASLEEHRRNLQENEPCPLCGATHHPWAEHLPPGEDGSEAQLKEAEKQEQDLYRQLNLAESDLKHIREQLAKLQSEEDELQKEKQQLSEQLQQNCAQWLQAGPADWTAILSDLANSQAALKNYEKEIRRRTGLAACLPLLEGMLAQSLEGKKLREQRQKLYTGDDINADSGQLRDQWLQVKQQLESLKARIKESKGGLDDSLGQRKKCEDKLLPALQQAGFESVQMALAARIPEKDYLRLSREANSLLQAIHKTQTEIDSQEKSLKEKQQKLSDITDEQLKKQLISKSQLLSELNEGWEEVKRLLKNHAEHSRKIEAVDDRIAREEKTGHKWELLSHLIGDATGKRFNDFAQDLSLQQLLILANRRLTQLSDRYQIDKSKAEEDEGLIAIDAHMGNQRRSVKTLSGGETFVLSLSLALALSDLASRNVEINSLFIDEGFGTLDPETLDQTLDTLERLQAESSKTIGIISHVEALKERIATQIQLERNGQGYSKIVIKG